MIQLTRWQFVKEWCKSRLVDLVPHWIAYKVAIKFWLFAYDHVTDQQADHFLDVLHAGDKYWGQFPNPEIFPDIMDEPDYEDD